MFVRYGVLQYKHGTELANPILRKMEKVKRRNSPGVTWVLFKWISQSWNSEQCICNFPKISFQCCKIEFDQCHSGKNPWNLYRPPGRGWFRNDFEVLVYRTGMEDGGTDGRSRNNHLFDTIWLYTGDVDIFEGQDQETVAGSGTHLQGLVEWWSRWGLTGSVTMTLKRLGVQNS